MRPDVYPVGHEKAGRIVGRWKTCPTCTAKFAQQRFLDSINAMEPAEVRSQYRTESDDGFMPVCCPKCTRSSLSANRRY